MIHAARDSVLDHAHRAVSTWRDGHVHRVWFAERPAEIKRVAFCMQRPKAAVTAIEIWPQVATDFEAIGHPARRTVVAAADHALVAITNDQSTNTKPQTASALRSRICLAHEPQIE